MLNIWFCNLLYANALHMFSLRGFSSDAFCRSLKREAFKHLFADPSHWASTVSACKSAQPAEAGPLADGAEDILAVMPDDEMRTSLN